MRLFLDTANIDHIRHGVELGVITGVTQSKPSIPGRQSRLPESSERNLLRCFPRSGVHRSIKPGRFRNDSRS